MLELDHVRRFSGGLRMRPHKALSTAVPISTLPMPERLAVAMTQHAGAPAEPVVHAGARVRRGDVIGIATGPRSAAVHAPATGTVVGLERRRVPTGVGLASSLCVILSTDRDARDGGTIAGHAWPADRAARLEAIRSAGLVGLGGAAFPTAAKLDAGRPCATLILNGAECEPYISCDDMLMRERAPDVVLGARIMLEVLNAQRCIVGIERDKTAALEAMRVALRTLNDERFSLAALPTIYPAGGERQLVESLTGSEVPAGSYPTQLGIVCHNVATAYAVADYVVRGAPLITRIVTVTGRGIRNPRNVEAPIGAAIGDLVAHCGGYLDTADQLILGGNMMGYALPSDDIPVTKSTNCIIAMTRDESWRPGPEWPCIRCGDCATACPARLQPEALLRATRPADIDGLVELGLEDCIECGCCDVVCPSRIPLTEAFRVAKAALGEFCEQALRVAAAERHYAEHGARIAAREADAEREQRDLRAPLAADTERRRTAIEAAVERARRRRATRDEDEPS